jgi:hypothetical protein
MGPAKLDAYGEEILEIVAAAVPADAARDAGAGPTPPTGAGGVGAGGRAT